MCASYKATFGWIVSALASKNKKIEKKKDKKKNTKSKRKRNKETDVPKKKLRKQIPAFDITKLKVIWVADYRYKRRRKASKSTLMEKIAIDTEKVRQMRATIAENCPEDGELYATLPLVEGDNGCNPLEVSGRLVRLVVHGIIPCTN